MNNLALSPVNRPKELANKYDVRGSYRLVASTGAVTTIAAATASAGHLFSFRWSSSTSTKCFVRFVGAKFILTTAYTTAQETGIDMILARSYTASHTAGTALDLGSTVTNSCKLYTGEATSLVVANACRIATASALTAGTHTLDPQPMGILSDFSTAIGITVPTATSGAGSSFGTLFDGRGENSPIMFTQDEGFILRNTILMGAVGVGRWDIVVEWDEGTPLS
jgi:hypothetical protein